MRHFKKKIDAGANVIFTQMFYDADGARARKEIPSKKYC